MGRATRWLKNLFGGRKDRKDSVDDRKEKRRWSFKSSRDSVDTPRRIPLADTPWLRSLYAEAEKEQSKHAIAVAAATAAAADAAVAAAEAAVAVVRLTRQGTTTTAFPVGDYRLSAAAAAIKIQTFFRGYLAKKALRALKSLVKLQALVRGYLIRKRAHATLHSMEALIRAQSIVRAQTSKSKSKSKSKPIISLKSLETFNDENRTQHTPPLDWSPKIVEIDTGRPSLHIRPSTPECRCSFTANSTPRYMNSLGGLVPPYVSPNYPNYMSNTLASEAKARWQSVPKQRPELSGSRKRIPLGELAVEQSRASLSCLGKQRPCFQDESLSFRSDVVGTKVDRSLEFYLQRKWCRDDDYSKKKRF